jgi:hypothetical protein
LFLSVSASGKWKGFRTASSNRGNTPSETLWNRTVTLS